MKMNLKMPFARWQPICLDLNVINFYVKHEYPIYGSDLKRYDMDKFVSTLLATVSPLCWCIYNLKITVTIISWPLTEMISLKQSCWRYI